MEVTMSQIFINNECIACDACRAVCPTQAIEVADPIYSIQQDLCFLCAGYAANPNCMAVCPVDAIVYVTVHLETLVSQT